MKKKVISIVAIGALLAQSSGVYAMGTARSRARRGAEFVGRSFQQYVGAPMGRVASAVSEEQRVQNVLNFLVQLGNDAKKVRSPQEFYALLKSYPKTSAAVGAIIAAILAYLFRGQMKRGIEQLRGPLTAISAAKKYNIPLEKQIMIATGEQVPSKSDEYQFLENLENVESAYKMYQEYSESGLPEFLLKNEVLQAADEVARGKRLQQLIIAYIRAGLQGRGMGTLKEQIKGAYAIAETHPGTPARGQWIKEKLDPLVIRAMQTLGLPN